MGVLTGPPPPRIIACIFTPQKIVFLTILCTWYTRKKIREMRFISNIKFGGSEAFKKSGKEGANDFWKRAMRENSTREALNSTKRKLPSNPNGGLSSSSPTRQVSTAVKASSNAVAQSSSSSSLNVPPMMKSALTSAGLGIVGDCVAQTLQRKPWEKKRSRRRRKIRSRRMREDTITLEQQDSLSSTSPSTARYNTSGTYFWGKNGRLSQVLWRHQPLAVCDKSILEPSGARAGGRRVLLRLVASAYECVYGKRLDA